MKKKLSLITATACNLNCSYCFLHKNYSYKNVDQKIIQAMKDGSYLYNIRKTLKELDVKEADIVSLDFWGGEPSLHLNECQDFFDALFKVFTNINSILYSSNFLTNINNHISFIKLLENNLDHLCHLSIQISIDGPTEINQQTRHYNYQLLQKNVLDFIECLNNIKLKYLTIDFYYKATMPWPIYKEYLLDYNNYNNYLSWCRQEKELISSKITNPNVAFDNNSLCDPSLVHPYSYTKQDGIDIALKTREIYLSDLSEKYPEYNVVSGLNYVSRWLSLDRDLFSPTSNCGQLYNNLLINWDGTLSPCSNGFLDGNLENLEWLKNNDYNEYLGVLKTKFYHDQYDEHGNIDYNKIKKLVKSQEVFWQYHINFVISALCSQIFDLAYAGLASKKYLTDFDMIHRHACYIARQLACYFENIRYTGSPYAALSDMVKMYCNGLLEFYEEVTYGNNN